MRWNEYENLKNEFKPSWIRIKLARLALNRRKRNERKASKPSNWRMK